MKSKKVLMIGPFPEPMTGVALANKIAKKVLEESDQFKVDVINTSYNRFDEAIGKFSFHKLFFYLSFNFKIHKVLKSDIVYITTGQTFFGVTKYFLFFIVSSLFNKKFVIHINGNHLGSNYQKLGGFKKKLMHFLVSKSTAGIVLSKSLRANLSPFIPEEKIHILYNFAEDYLAESTAISNTEELRIIYLSNLMEEKGIFHLLEALTILEQNNIPYKAQIAGAIDHTNKSKIEEYFQNLEHTKYLGLVVGDKKKELLEWGNTFILPTFYQMEGQPLSILEAMATHNIIVTTRHAGIPDILSEPENGFFVEKRDEKSIYDRLVFLTKNLEVLKTICDYNKEEFKQKFTVDHFRKNLIKILDEA